MNRRVLITGMGCLGAAGAEPGDLREALRRGDGLGRVERIDLGGGEWAEATVARVPDFDRQAYLPAARRRRMSRLSQDWVIACLKARADSGPSGTPPPERAAVCLGTAFGCLGCTIEYLDLLRRDGPGLGNPFLFSESVANAPAGHAAIELGCRGLNLTLTCGDASGVAAVEIGARAIREGRADVVYAGGVEEMPAALLAVLARLGALPLSGGERRRPWHIPPAGGNGAIPGEGAVCFVLEEREHARSRGAIPYAEIRAGALCSDPRAGDTRWSTSARVRGEALHAALLRSGLAPHEIDGAVLHVSGDAAADLAEQEAVSRVVGAERPVTTGALAVARPAGVVGQFAAAGAFGVATAALALRHQEFYQAECGAEGSGATLPGPGPVAVGIRHVVVSAASWGGSCLGLVLSRADY
jgi:3-oxoacyl-[acyl-carrier-protein] synthase II